MKGMDWEPQMGDLKNRVGIYQENKDPGRYIPTIFLWFPFWGSHFSPFSSCHPQGLNDP